MHEAPDFIIPVPIKNILRALLRYRYHCLSIIIVVTTTVVIYASFLPTTYLSIATIMNIDDSRGYTGSNNMLQVVGLAKNKNESFLKFAAIINSRSFKEQMVESLGTEVFTPKNGWNGTKEDLYNHALGLVGSAIRLHINPEQSNILNIMVEMQDDRLPPIIANQTLIVLEEYISNNALTKEKMVRQHVENSILETKVALFEMANSISNFYQNYAINPQKSVVEHPLQKEFLALDEKTNEDTLVYPGLEKPFAILKKNREKIKVKAEKIKEVSGKEYFDYLQDEYGILKEINRSLRQQYELAKLEDIRQTLSFQVLDRAKGSNISGPRRKLLTFVGFSFSVMFALFYVLIKIIFFSNTSDETKNKK